MWIFLELYKYNRRFFSSKNNRPWTSWKNAYVGQNYLDRQPLAQNRNTISWSSNKTKDIGANHLLLIHVQSRHKHLLEVFDSSMNKQHPAVDKINSIQCLIYFLKDSDFKWQNFLNLFHVPKSRKKINNH